MRREKPKITELRRRGGSNDDEDRRARVSHEQAAKSGARQVGVGVGVGVESVDAGELADELDS